MLNISKIQHFSVGDGDGIRTTVFCKGCNLRCPWCHNPENLAATPVTLCYKSTGKNETLGRRIDGDELTKELFEDEDFYRESGGGVTFSGGEAMLQADKIAKIAAILQGEGISVLIDTAGCVPYEYFELTNPFVDGYLFDFKTANGEKYRKIGGDLELVCDNIRRLISSGARVDIRIPLIPNFNTSSEDISAICRHLCGIGIERVTLIPFHRLGGAKYEAMGLEYAYADQAPLTKQELTAIKAEFEKHFEVNIE